MVRPRILTMAQLEEKLKKSNPRKNRACTAQLQEMLSFELRKYIPGDSLRHIHWKNSARTGELLVRKHAPQELYELVVIMDCTRLETKDELRRMQREDNIIETAVALIHDACLKKVRTRVVWCTDKLCDMRIDSLKSFDRFYSRCAELPFRSGMTLDEVWAECEAKSGGGAFWLIGCGVSPALTQKADCERRAGKEVVLIDTGEEPL